MIAQTNVQLMVQLIKAGWGEADLARADAAYRLTIPLFAGRFRSDGRPFVAHLCGTASLAASAGAAPDLVLAGLMHAVFQQGAWKEKGGATPADRARVAEVAGPTVLALIEAYDRLRWNSETILREGADTTAPGGEHAAVLLLRVANEADDHVDGAAAFGSKSRYAGKAEMLAAMDAIAARVGQPMLAAALRQGIDQGEALRVPAALRRAEAGSFNAAARPRSKLRRLASRVKRAIAG